MKKDVEKIIEGFEVGGKLMYEKDGKSIVETLKSVFDERIAIEVIDTTENEKSIKILVLSFINEERPTIIVKKI